MSNLNEYWPILPLRDLVADDRPICYGVLKPGEFIPEGIPLIRIVDLVKNQIVSEKLYRISKNLDIEFQRSRVLGGEVLVSIQGTIGRVAVVPRELLGANISRTIARLAVNSSVTAGFLSQWLRSPYGQRALADSVLGTTRDSLNIGILRQISIAVPPKPEQRMITEILDSADEAIQSTEQLIAKLEKVKQGLIRDLLTRGLDEFGRPRDQRRDPAVFHATTLGILPRVWKVTNLQEDSVKITDGTHQSVVATEQDSEGIPFLYVSCVGDNEIRWSRAGRISPECYKRISQGRIPVAGMVLYTAVGSYGHAAVIQEARDFAFQRHIACIYPDASKIEPAFMTIWLSGEQAKDISDRIAIGNAQKTVTLGALAEFPIPVPPKDEQVRLLAAAKPLDEVRFRELSNLAKLREIKRGLTDDLLSGRVRINAGDRRSS